MAEHHISTRLDDPLAFVHAGLVDQGVGLAGLLRAAEALRDDPGLLIAALALLCSDRGLLASVARASTIHPNGFAKVVLRAGGGYGIRLHVWKRRGGLWTTDTQPHGHRWVFASWIVVGGIREVVFEERDDGVLHQQYAYRRDPDGEPTLDPDGSARLAEERTIERCAGEVYGREQSTLHTATPMGGELAASLVLQGPHQDEPTPVFVPAQRGPNDREQPVSIDRLRELLVEVAAAVRE